ncbi:MAG: hypothetical protein PHE17_07310 [Thiothrix sp.]|uniref:hypothetical protein n=1 Tax=Thiothrix sp. TaxID=1032 RepID=UPI002623DAF5|nr:hypothetical protein [Thiothrix sp.]MDD5392812.1 hypothetical protein [Thiothrix sp.]
MDSFSPFLIGLLLGIIIGVVSYGLLMQTPGKVSQQENTLDLNALMVGQIQQQQQQNMLRQMQLDQARQEAEFRQLEESRVKYLALAQKPDYSAIVASVSRELERQGRAS